MFCPETNKTKKVRLYRVHLCFVTVARFREYRKISRFPFFFPRGGKSKNRKRHVRGTHWRHLFVTRVRRAISSAGRRLGGRKRAAIAPNPRNDHWHFAGTRSVKGVAVSLPPLHVRRRSGWGYVSNSKRGTARIGVLTGVDADLVSLPTTSPPYPRSFRKPYCARAASEYRVLTKNYRWKIYRTRPRRLTTSRTRAWRESEGDGDRNEDGNEVCRRLKYAIEINEMRGQGLPDHK